MRSLDLLIGEQVRLISFETVFTHDFHLVVFYDAWVKMLMVEIAHKYAFSQKSQNNVEFHFKYYRIMQLNSVTLRLSQKGQLLVLPLPEETSHCISLWLVSVQ